MDSFQSVVRKFLPSFDNILLRQLVGDRLQASHAQGRDLGHHLYGTQRVLAAWGQSLILQRAGLCHSLYSTDAFEQVTVPLTDRDRVRALIGKQSEELVYLFCAVQRAPLFRSLVRASSLEPSVTIPIEIRPAFTEAGNSISGTQARDLLILHMANFAEQAGTRQGQLSPWLDQLQRWLHLLAEKSPGDAPLALAPLGDTGRYAERQALISYLNAIDSSAVPDVAIAGMQEVARLLPLLADPHLWLSFFSAEKHDHALRRHHARIALDKLRSFGTTWDKRIPFEDWLDLAKAGMKRTLPENAFNHLRDLLISAPTSDRATDNSAALSPVLSGSHLGNSRFENYLQNVATSRSRKVAGFYPGLREDHFWSTETFQIVNALQREFTAIQQEIDALNDEQFQDEAENIDRTGAWKVFMLLEAGRWQEKHLKQLPILSRILTTSSEIRVAGGLAYISRLSPGTVIAAHTGPTNMRLRLHFGIHVPPGDCAMKVAGIQQHWTEGRCNIFNDFWEHEVWNRTNADRLVLLIDLWHPDITLRERKQFEAIHWISEQHARGLFEYWKQNEIMKRGPQAAALQKAADIDDLVL